MALRKFYFYSKPTLDGQFGCSPFSTSIVTLRFKDGFILTIHRRLLDRHPRLSTLAVDYPCAPPAIPLTDFSHSAGHVIVGFLYSKTWDELIQLGDLVTKGAGIKAKVKTAFEVYSFAQKYDITELSVLARLQIQCHAAGLNTFTLVDIAKEFYPVATDGDIWFPNYIKSRLKTDFESPASIISAKVPHNFSEDITIAKILFQSVLEVHTEKMQSLAQKTAPDSGVSTLIVGASLRDTGSGGNFESSEPTPEKASLSSLNMALEEPIPEPEPEPEPEGKWKKGKKKKAKTTKTAHAEPVAEPVIEPQEVSSPTWTQNVIGLEGDRSRSTSASDGESAVMVETPDDSSVW